jgi:hypothetical protein
MSGKTSLAVLIANYVTDFHRAKGLKSFVINTSALQLQPSHGGNDWDLVERLKYHFGVGFDRLDEISRTHKVFLIIDEAHLLFQTDDEKRNSLSPDKRSDVLWELAKQLRTNADINYRLLLLSAYGCSPQNVYQSTAVEFVFRSVVGYKYLLLKDEAIKHYIENYFDFYDMVKDFDVFCRCVKSITGGHVGLVSVLVAKLKETLLFFDKEITAT